jgi:hypothetical protein
MREWLKAKWLYLCGTGPGYLPKPLIRIQPPFPDPKQDVSAWVPYFRRKGAVPET